MFSRVAFGVGACLSLVLFGCTKRDPTYCDESIPCEGHDLVCDLEKKECVPAPDATVDLSTVVDTTKDLNGSKDAAADRSPSDAIVDVILGEGCVDTCPKSGARQCVANGFQVCANHDSDPCLEWGSTTACAANQFCLEGICLSWKVVPSGITTELLDVWGSSPTNVWAVGEAGTILHTEP